MNRTIVLIIVTLSVIFLSEKTIAQVETFLTHSYTFNDGTANDQVGSANGILHGGKIIKGTYISSSNGDYIELPGNEIAINTYDEITLEAFITAGDGSNSGYTMLAYFGRSVDNLGIDQFFMSIARGDNVSRTAISCGNENEPFMPDNGINGDELEDGKLHHVVSILTDSVISLYIDGDFIGSEILFLNNKVDSLSNELALLCKGGYTADGTWLGSVHEFNIYNKALNEDEVQELYSKKTSGDQIIIFNPIPDKSFVDKDFDPGAFSSSLLPISYASSDNSVATIENNKIHITGFGNSEITASQPGNGVFNPATDVTAVLSVNEVREGVDTTLNYNMEIDYKEIGKLIPPNYLTTRNSAFGTSISSDGDYMVIGSPGHNHSMGSAFVYANNSGTWEFSALLRSSLDSITESSTGGFGRAVAIDSNTIVIADDNNIYIFERPPDGWHDTTETVVLRQSAGNGASSFGNSVSISGNTLVVGAYTDTVNGISAGAVYVFEKPIAGWKDTTETARIYPSVLEDGDEFGYSVDIDGDTIVIGAPMATPGAAFVFIKPSSGWKDTTETAKLVASDGFAPEKFGNSVSISNDVIAIGTPDATVGSSITGAVYVYEKPPSGWGNMTETAKLSSSNGKSGDRFGYAVDISEEIIAVGRYRNWNDSIVYVFEKPISGWIDMNETSKLTVSVPSNGDFGKPVCVSDNFIIVGASEENLDNGLGGGSVYIFNKPVSGWEDKNEDDILYPTEFLNNDGQNFGNSLSIDNDIMVIGAPDYMGNKGCVYIFRYNGYGWDSIARLTASDGYFDEYFGFSVDVSGDVVVVGAYHDGYPDNYGAVYVFEKPVSGWADMTETAKLNASDATGISLFGSTVCIYDDIIVVGHNGNDLSSAYLFEKPVSGWTDMTETAKLTASDALVYDDFGTSVDIYEDVIVVGAYRDDDNGAESGSAYVFEKPVFGWADMTESAKIIASDGFEYDYFGNAVSIYKDFILIGAKGESLNEKGNTYNSGAAYIFKKTGTDWSNPVEVAKLIASDQDADDQFGYSLKINEDLVVVGSPNDDDYGRNCGSAYLFYKPDQGWSNMTETLKINALDAAKGDKYGESINGYGNNICIGAQYNDNDFNSNGAVYVNKAKITYIKDTTIDICYGDSMFLENIFQYNQGFYIDSSLSVEGNDSIKITILHVNAIDTTMETSAICQGEYYRGFTETGIYYITETASTGCDSIIEIQLSVNPVDTTVEVATICEGDEYRGFTIPGSHFIKETAFTGCDSITEIQLSVNELPDVFIGNDTTISADGTIELSSNIDASGYLWSTLESDKSIQLTGSEIGNGSQYWLQVTDFNNCQNSDTIYINTIGANDIVNQEFNLIKVFPNPSNKLLNIEYNNQRRADFIIQLISSDGSVLYVYKSNEMNLTDRIDLTIYPVGIYFLKIIEDDSIKVLKIIKE